jgi:hypothetical protein
MLRRLAAATAAASLIALLGASIAFAGEFTGNGKSLHVENSKWGTGLHARSFCAFSGQEDLQFVDENDVPLATPHKGVPGHAQSWGQIPKAVRDTFPAALHPGRACNPNYGPPPEG